MAVKEEIESVLHDLPADIQVYEPTAEIKELLAKQEKLAAVRLTPVRAMLLFLLYRYRVMGEHASEFAAEKLRESRRETVAADLKGIMAPLQAKFAMFCML